MRAALGVGASSVMASLGPADDSTTTRILDIWYRTSPPGSGPVPCVTACGGS